MDTVGILGDSRSSDLKNFEGTVHFGLSSPFVPNPVRRQFGFKVTNWRRDGGRVVFTDGEQVIADLDTETLETFQPIVDLEAEALREFTPVQRRVLRYIAMGASRASSTAGT